MKTVHITHDFWQGTMHVLGNIMMFLYWTAIIILTVSFAALGAYVLAEIFL